MSRPAPDSAAERDATRRQQDSDTNLHPLTAQQKASDEPPSAALHSAAQRCHTDALHCVFAFLGLADFRVVMQSCHNWHVAACKTPPLDLSATILSAAALDSLCASSLRRHVADLHVDWYLALRLDQLRLLRWLPHLTALECTLDAAQFRSALAAAGDSPERRSQLVRDALPPQLRRLNVTLSLVAIHSPADKQALLDALPSLAQLAELGLLDFPHNELDMSPLLRLPLLSRLSLGLYLTAQQCAVVKQLAALVCLDRWRTPLSFDDEAALQALLTPPHRLQRLQLIDLTGCAVTPPLMAPLQSLPALTELAAGSLHPNCWADLRGLTQLRKIVFWYRTRIIASRLAALGDSLSALPDLTDVQMDLREDRHLSGPPLQLRLPALRRLRLHCLRMPTLAFLQHSPLLEELRLQSCKEMSGDGVMASLHAHPPLRLRQLELIRCIELSAEQRAVLQPPSALLPALRTFACRP